MTKRVALVTGGAGELGRAICERLASQGCRIVAMDISVGNGAGEWQERMRAAGYELSLVQGDVTCFDSCAATVTQVEESVGAIDILVNCAGITRDSKLANMDLDMWNEVLTTNLDSVFNITRQVVQGMTQRGFGRIISISSLNGEKGQFGQTNYSAAKAGMHGFTKALAQEVARKGVTVNTVSPGYMDTRMVRAVPEDIRAQILEQIPLGRFGKTTEIGAVVAFLASEDASYVTGANFSVNGGHHMH
ncbi:MAG: beta-ketoacyl-ACP reductase [Gammaproteobacteria bacterium]|nr:MAG: beta-ketoacyl-ACP reductase [Gammaproteobacteria bacterium]